MGRTLEESAESPRRRGQESEGEGESEAGTTPVALTESPLEDGGVTEAEKRARGAAPVPAKERGPVMSERTRSYFRDLMGAVENAYEVARAARRLGKDPVLEVEILPAEDLAARVEAQVHVPGVAKDIRVVTKELGNRELVALEIAGRVARGHYGEFKSRELAVDKAVRTGLSILTEGVLVAPLEGIAEVKIGKNSDGSDYVDLYFAGPIRAAGGTAQALSVLIADVVRREAGIGVYQVTAEEVERYKEEVPAYRQAANLQYTPDVEEIDMIVRNCPVCLNGEGTDKVEVTGNRDLPRVPTNQLRGGAMLVLCEGMCLKAPKILKHVRNLGLEGWDFLDRLLKKHEEEKEQDSEVSEGEQDEVPVIEPASKYVRDLIAGRPVFSHPSRPGGFRLRYGRARTAGLAAVAVHPAVMPLLDDFLAIGTQLKTERPGKGTIATPCNVLEPPAVILKNGDLMVLSTAREVQAAKPFIQEIVDLGEILVPFGEFAENNHLLMHSPWVLEWFEKRLAQRAEADWPEGLPAVDEVVALEQAGDLAGPLAHEIAAATGVALAPSHTLAWHDMEPAEIARFSQWIAASKEHVVFTAPKHREVSEDMPGPALPEEVLVLPSDLEAKTFLERMLVPHRQLDTGLEVVRYGYALVRGLGFERDGDSIVETARRKAVEDGAPEDLPRRFAGVELASRLAGVPLMPKHPFRIGARMGRPEKASQRKMKPPPHSLFPIAKTGGMQRLFASATVKSTILVETGKRACAECGQLTFRTFCTCGGHTEPTGEPEEVEIDLRKELRRAVTALEVSRVPPKMKGVEGLMSAHKTPEPLEKGILRAKNEITTFKDGTARFDMTDAPLTHFRPREISTSVERLIELGYDVDHLGEPLERDDQLLELKVQDIVVPETCGDFLVSCARFVDDLLVRFYGMDPFYKAEKRNDLVGHLVGGLAPHTSGAIAARVIGFTPSQMGWAHPYFHAGKRRNCLHPESEVYTWNSPGPTRITLEVLYAKEKGEEVPIDDVGTRVRQPKGLRVLAVDPATGRAEEKRVSKIYKIPSPEMLVKIKTKSGREVVCSPLHRMIVDNGNGLTKKKALELQSGDILLSPETISLPENQALAMDLLEGLARDPPDGLVLRGIERWLEDAILELGGLSAAAKTMGTTPKSLDNYRRRNSIPWGVIQNLLKVLERGFSDLPTELRIAVIRDTVELPRWIPWSPELARLVGYYLAEGYARTASGKYNQISIAATEPEIIQDVIKSSDVSFGLSPSQSGSAITLSGRLVHWFFTRYLDLGESATTKRIPARVLSLPTEISKHVVSAYFSGDGSVEKGRLHVTANSVNPGLLRDFGLLLSAHGIISRLRAEKRQGGGAVKAFYEKKGEESPYFTSHTLSIRSTHAVKFFHEIGFTLARKKNSLESSLHLERHSRLKSGPGELFQDPIKTIDHVRSNTRYLYDLEVEDHHNFLVNDLTLTSNCDGDEDAIFLLMDGLLNFSKHYVPDRRGGLMDLPLVLTTRLDPSEIDKEAHNLDVLGEYPLAFYETTTTHAHPRDVEKQMGLVASRLGQEGQYEGLAFTHDTPDISQGVLVSAYKTIPDMMAKLEAQFELADRIRAVDLKDVASRVIGGHFMPDLIGNLKAFSKQKVRCPTCNTKYRRMPVAGRCMTPDCKGRLTLTVHEGSVRKYLKPALEISRKYEVPPYTLQRIMLAEKSIDSLFNNDKVRKAKLTDFIVEAE